MKNKYCLHSNLVQLKVKNPLDVSGETTVFTF